MFFSLQTLSPFVFRQATFTDMQKGYFLPTVHNMPLTPISLANCILDAHTASGEMWEVLKSKGASFDKARAGRNGTGGKQEL